MDILTLGIVILVIIFVIALIIVGQKQKPVPKLKSARPATLKDADRQALFSSLVRKKPSHTVIDSIMDVVDDAEDVGPDTCFEGMKHDDPTPSQTQHHFDSKDALSTAIEPTYNHTQADTSHHDTSISFDVGSHHGH